MYLWRSAQRKRSREISILASGFWRCVLLVRKQEPKVKVERQSRSKRGFMTEKANESIQDLVSSTRRERFGLRILTANPLAQNGRIA